MPIQIFPLFHFFPFQFETVKIDEKTTVNVPVPMSPLCELGYFGMVSGFPLETMHTLYKLICDDFMETLLETIEKKVKIDDCYYDKKEILASRIEMIRRLTPSEFQRKLTGLDRLSEWKATEFRQFFLYLATALFEGLVDDTDDTLDKDQTEDEPAMEGEEVPTTLELIHYFQHFMYLLCGADPTPVPEEDLTLAQGIAEFWVASYIKKFKLSSGFKPSTHWMLHLVAGCREHGAHLDELSVYRFENHARKIRPKIKSGFLMLEQLRNRIMDDEKLLFNRDENGDIVWDENGKPSVGIWAPENPENHVIPTFLFVPERAGITKLRFQDFVLSNARNDSFALVCDDDVDGESRAKSWRSMKIVQVKDIVRDATSGEVCIHGTWYMTKEPLYKEPEDSRNQHVYVFRDPCTVTAVFPASAVYSKLFVVPRFSKFPLQEATENSLGSGFENVHEWIGVGLQHSKAVGQSSLY